MTKECPAFLSGDGSMFPAHVTKERPNNFAQHGILTDRKRHTHDLGRDCAKNSIHCFKRI